ncbi:MAG TPA: DUF3857 domain-containing protein [Thermoanaerobaculia bacterium]|nr:DUF3857 domain-containing protein [Thermoanaerobaculia bacterium]
MRRILAASCLLFLPVLASAKDEFRDPTPEELKMTTSPVAPGASAVILNWISKHDDEGSFANDYYRIKILTQDGKKYGDIELTYAPGFSDLKNISARTIKPDGTIVPFTGKMYNKLVIKKGGFKVMNRTFSLPDVQPGSIIEYRYTRTWSLQLLNTNRWYLQRELPILNVQLWVKPYGEGVSSFFTYKGLPAGKAPVKVGDHFELELTNIPPFDEEPYAPPDNELKPRVEFFYTMGKPDVEKYWTDWGKEYGDAVESYIGDRSGIKKIALETIAGAATEEAKLRKLYQRVQQIRNLSFEEDKTEQEERREKLRDNRHSEDVIKNGYGYRSELNLLFVALARAAGFQANAVRVSQRDEIFFSKSLPDKSQLTAEVATVVVDGKQRYFDPGTPFTPFGLLPWENTFVQGVQLARKSPGTWLQVPDNPSTDAITKRNADLHLEGDVLKGTVTVTYNGQYALQERLGAKNHDEATNRKSFEDDVKGWFPDGSTVKLTKMSSLTATDEPLVLDFDVEVANLGTVAGSRALLPMSVFAASRKTPFSAEARRNPIYYSYAHRYEDDITLHMPEGYSVESIPQPLKMDLGGAAYSTQYANANGTLTLKRSMAINTVLIGADNYKVLRSFYSRVANADQETVVLKKAAK